LAVAAAALLGLVVYAWLPKPVPVDFDRVTRGSMRVTVDEDGRTRVKDRHVVSAPLAGNLGRIELDPGAEIERGQILARIVPLAAPLLNERSRAEAEARVAAADAALQQSRAAIDRAEAAHEFAKTEAERQRRLEERGSASRAAVDRAELELRTRREELTSARFGRRVAAYERRMAEAALGRLDAGEAGDQLEVPSPVDGKVLKVMQESEGVVQAGTPLLEVGNPAALEIVVDVLTTDAVHVEPGDRVEIIRWGGDGALQAHVARVEPSAFESVSALGVTEQRVNVVIDLDSPREQWKALGDGFRVEANIVIWQGDDVLTVPASAVFRHEQGWAVYRVEDRLAELVPVTIGKRNGSVAEVKEGLAEGETVILHPSDRVRGGIEVTRR
jgi:HlyD family secretion protein